jgi:hypothetical protein
MMSHSPNSQGQMSPPLPNSHSPVGGAGGGPPPSQQQQQQQGLAQQQHHGGHHGHLGHLGYGGLVPHATPSPVGHGDMSPQAQHQHHMASSSPPVLGHGGWGGHAHQQDIKPPMGHMGGQPPSAAMFQPYSWYQPADNMNQGLLT